MYMKCSNITQENYYFVIICQEIFQAAERWKGIEWQAASRYHVL